MHDTDHQEKKPPSPDTKARVLVGHTLDSQNVVLGLEGREASLVYLPLSEAAQFSRQLAALVRKMRRSATNAKKGDQPHA